MVPSQGCHHRCDEGPFEGLPGKRAPSIVGTCASDQPLLPLRTVPTNTEVFSAVYDYAGKADLSKGYWNPKRKRWVTMHFSEIIKEQYF